MNKNLEHAATLIGSSLEDMNALPLDIRMSISDEIEKLYSENNTPTTKARSDAYSSIYKLWVKGNVNKCMIAVSEITGIPHFVVKGLPYYVKEKLYYEYTLDHSDTETMYRTIQNYFSVSDLDNISVLVDVPVTKLKELPREIQTRICGIYSMEYGEAELIFSLKEALRHICNQE